MNDDTFDVFSAPPNDLSLVLLKEILGDWTDGTPLVELFSGAMSIFNIGVIGFASLMFLYTAIVGTLQSAHDGQLLGKRWSTVWVPIRFSFAVVLLVPTVTGLSLAQHSMLYLVSQGVGLASQTWIAGVERYAATQNTHLAVRAASDYSVRQSISDALRAEMCVAYINSMSASTGNPEPVAGRAVVRSGETWVGSVYQFLGRETTGGSVKWGGLPRESVSMYGTRGIGYDYAPDACGRVDYPNSSRKQSFIAGQLDIVAAHEVADIFASVQIDALQEISENIFKPFATDYFSRSALDRASSLPPSVDVVNAVLNDGVIEYQKYIAHYFDKIVQEKNAALTDVMLDDAKNNGWMGAGTWYFQINRITQDLNSAAQNIPIVKRREYAKGIVSGAGLVTSMPVEQLAVIDAALNTAAEIWLDSTITTRELVRNVPSADEVGSTERFALKRGVNMLSHYLFGITDADSDSSRHFGYDPSNPAPAITQFKTIGDYFVSSVTVAVGLAALADSKLVDAALTIKAPWLKILKDKATASFEEINPIVANVLSFVAIVLGIFGIVLAYWLPILPFVIWIGAVAGWIMSTIEMLIATPVWVAAHMHPDGEGVAGQHAASGYMLLIEAILRPVFMLFGFIAAVIVVDPLLNMTTAYYYTTLATTQADTATGLISWTMKIVLLVMLCWMVINLTFKAITAVPNGAMSWIGGRSGTYANAGDEMSRASQAVLISGLQRLNPGSMRGLRNKTKNEA